MTTQHFEARRIGGEYVVVPVGGQADVKRRWSGLLGLISVWLGFRRGGRLGALMALAGGSLICHSLTGTSALRLLAGSRRGGKRGDPRLAPSHSHDWARERASQLPADAVDEANMESFPASDPPARSHATP